MGGTIFRFYGGDIAVMRGDIELMGGPPVPPPGKTLVCIEICKDPINGLQSYCSPNLPQSVQVELSLYVSVQTLDLSFKEAYHLRHPQIRETSTGTF